MHTQMYIYVYNLKCLVVHSATCLTLSHRRLPPVVLRWIIEGQTSDKIAQTGLYSHKGAPHTCPHSSDTRPSCEIHRQASRGR